MSLVHSSTQWRFNTPTRCPPNPFPIPSLTVEMSKSAQFHEYLKYSYANRVLYTISCYEPCGPERWPFGPPCSDIMESIDGHVLRVLQVVFEADVVRARSRESIK
jgi:hypothetical protein